MKYVPTPADLKSLVADFDQEFALTDSSGRVVAYVVPPDLREMMYRMAAELLPHRVPDDPREAIRSGSARTTSEILNRLQLLQPAETVG